MLKLKKQNHSVFWIAELIFLCFLVGGLGYVWFVRQWNEEQSIRFLNDATLQRRAALLQQFEGDLQVLRGVAVSLGQMDLSDGETVFGILDTINQGNFFVRMGLAGTNGSTSLVDLNGTIYHDYDLSGASFFRRALNGNDSVSRTFHERLTDEYVNYYAVPILKQDQVAGVLCAVNKEEILRKIISVPVFRGEGHFAVVDEKGDLVAPTETSHPAFALGANLLDHVSFPNDERLRFSRALTENLAGSFKFSIGADQQLGVLQPLGINKWFVLSTTPRSSINAYYNRTAVGITVLIVAASLVFLLLMYRQIRTMSKSQKALERLAYTDPLTGRRNYTKFALDADRMIKTHPNRNFAVWSFDIKNFGRINELYGNATGDLMIERVADLFAAQESEFFVFCRHSADLFAGLYGYERKEELSLWSAELFENLLECGCIAECSLRIDGAMGLYCIGDFETVPTIDEMLNRASVAKKEAKETAGSEVRFFTHEMSERIRREMQLEASGRTAVAEGEIFFFLQPKVSIQNGYRITGAEVLARWLHPSYGWIPPTEFIPLFEHSGFVVTLDRAIFEQACRWYSSRRPSRENDFTQLAINVSRQGLLRDDFVEYYVSVKRKYGIADGVLELEFTESVILNDHERFQNIVVELQNNGFICSIDDFGSGYSSLNVLKNLPINVLKLDALFFRESNDLSRAQTVIANFIGMAKKLRIRTVAEGVENKTQVEFLKNTGCDVVQGYVFSQPLSHQDFELLLRNSRGNLHLP